MPSYPAEDPEPVDIGAWRANKAAAEARTKPKAAETAKVRRRANGEGSIYHVESEDRWRAALTWTDEDGVPHRHQVTAKTQDAARHRLTKLRNDLDEGRTPASSMTVADFLGGRQEHDGDGKETKPLRGWLKREQGRIRPSTWRQREQYIRTYVMPAIGKVALGKLAPVEVERMTASMIKAGLAPRTAAAARVILRRALSDALRDGLVHRNVAALARPPRVPVRDIEYLDGEQLKRLFLSARSDRLGPLVILAAATGLRQGEILGLQWPDIAGGSLTVRRSLAITLTGTWTLAETKTGRSRRTINLPAAAVVALEDQRTRQEALKGDAGSAWQDRDGTIFTDELGRKLKGYSVTAGFHRLLREAGLPSVPFHALRHSTATVLLGAGVPLRVVADLLGHSTIVVTANVYAAVVPELRREAADAMDRVLE